VVEPDAPVRVLVVDDDFMVARVHRDVVQRIPGFVVVGEARTGAEALELVAGLRPDVVLLDVYLPDIAGTEVLERIRSGDHPADVVMITAARDAATVAHAMRYGAVHYLVKPFSSADLVERLRQVAEARRHLSRTSEEPWGQADVDRVFRPVGPAAPSARTLPKGLSQETMELVVEGLRGQVEAEAAADVGERIGLSRVSTRRYLERLVAMGWVEVTLKYGSTGRPERRYRWSRD
jgi:response regulator of citrate/malate metabolism